MSKAKLSIQLDESARKLVIVDLLCHLLPCITFWISIYVASVIDSGSLRSFLISILSLVTPAINYVLRALSNHKYFKRKLGFNYNGLVPVGVWIISLVAIPLGFVPYVGFVLQLMTTIPLLLIWFTVTKKWPKIEQARAQTNFERYTHKSGVPITPPCSSGAVMTPAIKADVNDAYTAISTTIKE